MSKERTTETYKTLVKTYHYRNNDYVIVKGLHDGIIRAVNYKYIDSDGKLTKQLNGLEMFCDHNANTVNDIIRRINNKLDWDNYLIENNVDANDNDALRKAAIKFFKLDNVKGD